MLDAMFTLDRPQNRVYDASGRHFDLATRAWRAETDGTTKGEGISPSAALAWVQQETSGAAFRVPVAVIGPREPTAEQADVARAVGTVIGSLGLTLLTGGKSGVMSAASEGARLVGGLTIGLLPDEDPALANPHVMVPIATGIGVARNALIARAAACLVAVGGGYGTLSEIAYGLQFGKRVFTLAGAPVVDGAVILSDPAEVGDAVAAVILSA